MSLGTFDRTPPPFFRQGPSALTKLAFFSALALFLMVADTRFEFARPLRAAVATTLLPVQRTLAVPVQLWQAASDYLRGLADALGAEKAAQQKLAQQAEKAARADRLERENDSLRALLGLRPALQVRSQAADVLYEASDPFSRKLFIDRGLTHGVVLGSPVIAAEGVLGQVTRVFPLSSQVTLLVDKDAAIPVLNTRTLARSAAFGGSGGDAMELRYMAANADVRVGDELATSGVDGVYPPGLAVATVTAVERRAESGFARILLAPAALADGVRHVLVLEPVGLQQPPREAPPAVEDKPTKAERPAKAVCADEHAACGGRAMIMRRGADQLLLPVNPLFIGLTLLLALGLNLLPLGRHAARPDLLALVLVFWNVHQPRRVGVGVAFFFGLLMDVHEGALLGQHALAYTLLSFGAISAHRRLLWFSLAEQAVQVLPLFLAAHLVSLIVRMLAGGMFPGWELLFAPLLEALLWPVVTAVLLAPQRRPPDPDQNRPL